MTSASLFTRLQTVQPSRFGRVTVSKEADDDATSSALATAVSEMATVDQVRLSQPEKPDMPPGRVRQSLGLMISALSLGLSLVSMGLISIPKAPLMSLPFFGIVMAAFALNESMIALAEMAGIPTVHHSDSLKRLFNLPANLIAKQVLGKTWPIFYGGKKQKEEVISTFLQKSEDFTDQITQSLVKNPLFEDLSENLRHKKTAQDKISEVVKSAGKVLLTVAIATMLPRSARLVVGPWLTQALGFPMLDKFWDQLDAHRATLMAPTPSGPADSKASSVGKSAAQTTSIPAKKRRWALNLPALTLPTDSTHAAGSSATPAAATP